jgi:hypothetical protein
MKAKRKPATVAQIAATDFKAVKDFSEVSKDERLRNTRGLIERVRLPALLAVEFLVFDKDELIAKAAADYDDFGSILMAIDNASDALEALQDIVTAAKTRLAIALANVEGKPAAA